MSKFNFAFMAGEKKMKKMHKKNTRKALRTREMLFDDMDNQYAAYCNVKFREF